MFLLDLFSIYLVALKRPFYFDVPVLEKILLLMIMLSDVSYDGLVYLILGYNAIYSAIEAIWI